MAFTFGSSGSTFGAAANKPTAFGSPIPFGAPAATTASTGFGFGSTFGAQPAQQAAFGSTFGQPAAGSMAPSFGNTFGQPASAAPAFGSTFGTPATAAPAFGSTFGTPSTAAPAFGSTFGAPVSATATPAFGSAFGAPATSAPAFGSTFGAAPTNTTSVFGSSFGAPAAASNLFGATPAKPAPSLFGTSTTTQVPSLFGTTTTTTAAAPSLFGNPPSTAPPLFGSTFTNTATTSAPNLFGTGTVGGFGLGASAAPSTGFNLFASAAAAPTTTTAPSLFSGFGKTTTTASGFPGFGTTTPAFTGFGNTATSATGWFGGTNTLATNKPMMPTAMGIAPQTQDQQIFSSIYAINVFGDERDAILKKWNLLQASWGVGKGYYNASQPPVEYNSNNPFFRYKSIGYAVIPGEDNSNGLIKMNIGKKESELSNQKEALTNGLLGILGNKPNLMVKIEHIKSIGDNQCEVMFSVEEKGVTGLTRKIPALDLSAFLNQSVQKQQLSNVGVTFIGAYVTPTRTQIQEYLKSPPPGIELQYWQAAQINNPNPRKFIPIVVNGFTDLRKRMLCEQYECNIHREYLNVVGKELVNLNKKHTSSLAKISELKQKHAELQHRLLKIIIRQEGTRKLGMALQPEEEILKGRLEQVMNQMSLPSQYKGQLYELRCKMNLDGTPTIRPAQRYGMDPQVQEDINQFLKMEQNGIAHLMQIINKDMQSLKIISDGLEKLKKN